MPSLIVKGGNPIGGTIRASGNKNAILPMIAAALLTDEEVLFKNVPDIRDVVIMLSICESIGVEVNFSKNVLSIKAANIKTNELERESCDHIRTSFLFVAPLLSRTGKALVYPPGGDVIGKRRLDTHFYGLSSLGAEIETHEQYSFTLKGKFQGKDLFFDEASVTATEHIIMAAVISEGKTIIRNAASEPHVQDLIKLLNSMGANIEGANTNTLTIHGVQRLHGTTHQVVGDHIEVGSFLAIAAATGADIKIEGTEKSHYWMTRRIFERLGINLILEHDYVKIEGKQRLEVQRDFGNAIPVIDDGPWPQFPSDMMSSVIVLATQVQGTVLFFEKMFESRMYFVDQLNRMGANAIVCDPHRVVISGKSQLRATRMSSPDIRAGMALLGAALCADGTSQIANIHVIDRGYENVEQKLTALGADIERVDS